MDPPRLEAYRFHERDWGDYEALYEAFEWDLPPAFNIATYACDRWAGGGRTAVLEVGDGADRAYTFGDLRERSNRLANWLADRGVGRGDRVGVVLPQRPEALIAHLATWKRGAVSVPASTRHGRDAVEYRLEHAGTAACVVDAGRADALASLLADRGATLVVGDGSTGEPWSALEDRSPRADVADTDPDDDALLLYTSGTTGDPKGVLHGHRVLLGHLPQFLSVFCDVEIREGDRHWTPVEWAWIASFLQMACCALFYGVPVVADVRDRFDPERALELIETRSVTNLFAPPTALRRLCRADHAARDVSGVRVVASAGEALDEGLIERAGRVFDAPVNDAYGQTEANGLVCGSDALIERKAGAIGKPTPGHEVRVLDPDTLEPVEGELGEIAVRYDGDPVCFKRYWRAPERTDEAVREGWLLTGDLGTMDADGYLSYAGRSDDLIVSAGYRISPLAVERTLLGHDAVAEAAVVGVPDRERGEVPRAHVVLAPDAAPSDALAGDLRDRVRERLAAYARPRSVEFVDALPKTESGKIKREALREQS